MVWKSGSRNARAGCCRWRRARARPRPKPGRRAARGCDCGTCALQGHSTPTAQASVRDAGLRPAAAPSKSLRLGVLRLHARAAGREPARAVLALREASPGGARDRDTFSSSAGGHGVRVACCWARAVQPHAILRPACCANLTPLTWRALLLDACGAGGATAQEDLGAIVELCHAAAPPAAAQSDSGSGAEEGLGAMPSLQAQRLRVWNDPLRNGGKKKHFICAVPGCENPSVSQRARGRERETLQCD